VTNNLDLRCTVASPRFSSQQRKQGSSATLHQTGPKGNIRATEKETLQGQHRTEEVGSNASTAAATGLLALLCSNAHRKAPPQTYKRMEPTHRMDSTGLFSLIRLSVSALTAFFSPHQLSAIDPSCCTLVASRRVASRRVTQDSLLRRTRLILRLSALSLRVPLAT
jgi:hypothetical protein